MTTSLVACRQAYNPPAITAANNYFVVDGFINIGANAVTTFNLNRSRNLGDSTVTGIPELNAVASIVSSSGASYPLTDTANTGIYSSAPSEPGYNAAIQHRHYHLGWPKVFIRSRLLQTDPADRQPVLATTIQSDHLCEYTRPHRQYTLLPLRLPGDLGTRRRTEYPLDSCRWHTLQGADSTNQKVQCWNTAPSTNIILATSAALAQDVIVAFPVETIPLGDARVDIGYSILVRQYAMTEDAYNYWLLIQKTTQDVGTLFDVQPTQLIGNIHCLTNPSAPVIGFISASSVQQHRVNIYPSSLSDNWTHNSPGVNCNTIEIGYNRERLPGFLLSGYIICPLLFQRPGFPGARPQLLHQLPVFWRHYY
jgi:hypothetical protein